MLHLIFWSALCLTSPVVAGRCKNTPVDVTWPSDTDWLSLNASIGAPAAASCWPNSHFETPISCNTVQSQWTNALWLASQPDSDCDGNELRRDISWKHPTKNITEDVYIVGSGQQWGNGRAVTTGQDPSVGLGGYIQESGHGPLSRTYGLAATLRGGGPGLYGLVTEYLLRHHPAPRNVTMRNLLIAPEADRNNISAEASWKAAVPYLQALPVLMDTGLAGACMMSTADTAVRFGFLFEATTGVVISQAFWSFNSTPSAMEAFIRPVSTHIGHESTPNRGSSAVTITFSTSNVANYTSCISAISGTLLPTWRTAYLHFIANGATVDSVAAGSPKRALQDAARWYEAKERMRQLWAPESRAYMNEANPLDPEFKRDFYGANYDRLVQVKANNDPNESLFVLASMGSDWWDYDLDSGRLCRVD
ncbi:uncharacterized protein BO95DRAFT_454111 [Aspergillus brunneoviolaceus CBS 621.78]|uniref:Uncharacterized protein n=1 Tax=Aspergillus brunneoviolaceus CBS 621.78 TaxID=1450534 RepID=A0ACD1G5U0_9EURO|nr:hypothetical protein BO95DRAFT_454111 [Aspergillus brunneoviolaceus CBS 621.78]RAH44589.1 hypothetical protein BO95DRAFT_454111 [Aspergillus brunneoviolaceus CBS 621.78]